MDTGKETGFNQIVLFFLLTFAFSFGVSISIYYLPELYYAQSYETAIGIIAVIIASLPAYGPSISAIIVTARFEGKEGLKQFIKSLLKFRIKYYWYLFAFFLPVFVYSIPTIIDLALGNPANNDYFNTSLWGITFSVILVNIISAAFAEEPGWRGYALPKLNQHYKPIISGIIIGVIWAFWHLLFYVFGARPWSTFPQFVFTVTTISCIYTWMYMKTKSIPLMVVFHVMHNLTNTAFIKYHDPLLGGIIYFIILVVIIIADKKTLLNKTCTTPLHS